MFEFALSWMSVNPGITFLILIFCIIIYVSTMTMLVMVFGTKEYKKIPVIDNKDPMFFDEEEEDV